MDESAKFELRNYTMAAGFFVIAVTGLFVSGSTLLGTLVGNLFAMPIIPSIMVFVGVLLVFLEKRDLTAITFLLYGIMMFFLWMDSSSRIIDGEFPHMRLLFDAFLLLLAVLILTSHDQKKYFLAIIPILLALLYITPVISSWLGILFGDLLALVTLYYAFVCASERVRLPGYATLTSDVVTNFKINGSVLGYFLFAISGAAYTLSYLTDGSLDAAAVHLDMICSIFLILSGVLLLVAGKMRFTPVYFMLLGCFALIGTQVSGIFQCIIGVMAIFLGLFAILRLESRVLLGVLVIIDAGTYFVAAFFSSGPLASGLEVILYGVPCLLAIYLAFAVFSQSKKLPVF